MVPGQWAHRLLHQWQCLRAQCFYLDGGSNIRMATNTTNIYEKQQETLSKQILFSSSSSSNSSKQYSNYNIKICRSLVNGVCGCCAQNVACGKSWLSHRVILQQACIIRAVECVFGENGPTWADDDAVGIMVGGATHAVCLACWFLFLSLSLTLTSFWIVCVSACETLTLPSHASI